MHAVIAEAGIVDFESFFHDEYERLYKALCLFTGRAHEAEEVAQEAFVIVWERWDRVASMDSPVGYLYRVAMNAARHRFRRGALARRHAGEPSSVDELQRIDDQDEAWRALQSLSPQQRAALILTGYLGCSSDEAAVILGNKASTVRVLTARARAAVRGSEEGGIDG
jgi:RNA polymerase sigma-70 factor (ECF subfamily)